MVMNYQVNQFQCSEEILCVNGVSIEKKEKWVMKKKNKTGKKREKKEESKLKIFKRLGFNGDYSSWKPIKSGSG